MYKMCKTEQSAQRQQLLEQGLLKEMLVHRYEEISVSDLCQSIGIPRKSFYRYFSGKDGALHALIDHTLMEYEPFSAAQKDDGIRSYEKDLEKMFLFWKQQKLLLDALARSDLSGVLIERSIQFALSEIGIPKQYLVQQTLELRVQATAFGVCGLMAMVTSWHRDNFPSEPWQMAQVAVKLVTEPLFSIPGL